MAAPGTFSSVLPAIHPAGWPFIAAFFAAAVIVGFLWAPLFWLGLIATAWCVYFFRDPVRMTPDDPALVVSPADGVVVTTAERVPPPELGLGDRALPCIGIFMNVFDVHVNRTPVAGEVVGKSLSCRQVPERVVRQGLGRERAAMLAHPRRQRPRDRACPDRGPGGPPHRRPSSEQGAALLPGQRVGLIRFGSRCDVYLPEGVEPLVLVGQRTLAGETVLADLFGNQPKRQGRAG